MDIETKEKKTYHVKTDDKSFKTDNHHDAERHLARHALRKMVADGDTRFGAFMDALDSITAPSNVREFLRLVNDYVNPWRVGWSQEEGWEKIAGEERGSLYHFYDVAPNPPHGAEMPHKRNFSLHRKEGGKDLYDDTKWRLDVDHFASPPSSEHVRVPEPKPADKEETDG